MFRYIALLFFLILCFASPLAAQFTHVKPNVSISCPAGAVTPGDVVPLTGTIRPTPPKGVTYNWSTTFGAIESGQGTPAITLSTAGAMGTIYVSLELGGTPIYFERLSATCDIAVLPTARLLAESPYIKYEGGRSGLMHSRRLIDPIVAELAADPTAQLYILIRPGVDAAARRKAASARKELDPILFDLHKVDRSRVTFADAARGSEMQFYLVPAGATPPEGAAKTEPRNSVKADANACELNSLYIDQLRSEVANNPQNVVVVVASPGERETAMVNALRLRVFMDRFSRGISQLVPETGERTGGRGRIDVYLREPSGEQKHFLAIEALRNRSICTNCCSDGDYPFVLTRRAVDKRLRPKKQN